MILSALAALLLGTAQVAPPTPTSISSPAAPLILLTNNGVTVAIHGLVTAHITNQPVVIATYQIVQHTSFDVIQQISEVNGQQTITTIHTGSRTNWLTTNLVSKAAQPGWPPSPIINGTNAYTLPH